MKTTATSATPLSASRVSDALHNLGDPQRAAQAQRFFKTGKGEYGEHDSFLGIAVPIIRQQVKLFKNLPLTEIAILLQSPFNEERLFALLSMNALFTRGNDDLQRAVYEFFLQHRQHVNNWNLVDTSAACIVGGYLQTRDKSILHDWALSPNLWERRIAMVATHHFIRADDFDDALVIATALRHDSHDLIQKAVGWMLREIGKRDAEAEKRFLKRHYKTMPRTMLRYAIERLPEAERLAYLAGYI